MPVSTIDFRKGYSNEIDLKLMFYLTIPNKKKGCINLCLREAERDKY